MADILGMGLSHYPGPLVPVEHWPNMLKRWVEIGRIKPADFAEKERWPALMRVEWGDDEGQSAARSHQVRLAEGYRALRARLDAFQPDIVVIFGDDQFENYKRDCIPPASVGIFNTVACKPFRGGEFPFGTSENPWGIDADTVYPVACHYDGAMGLTRSIIESGCDIAYSMTVRHPAGLAHSFANTVVFLDRDLQGFPYPIIPVHINCYGNQLISTGAGAQGEGATMLSPPAPRPRNCFELGRAVARHFRDSPYRVCIIGSSSWSHGSLTPKHGRLYPDVPADRALFSDLQSGRFRDWSNLDPDALDDAGQHELLNWIALAGAMSELDQDATIVDYVETHVFNSTKCFAIFEPHAPSDHAPR